MAGSGRLQQVFSAAMEIDSDTERRAYLDQTCTGDDALREKVERLLRAHEEAGSFMMQPDPDANGSPTLLDVDVVPLDFLEHTDQPGSLGRLGHFEVLEVIGHGGMGVVLRAFDEGLHRVVAIKVMTAQLAANAAARKRFAREAHAAAAVTHDNIVTIHAVDETDGMPYLVMQYVSGLSLQQRLDRDGPMELVDVVRIGMQTALGLAAAHAHGLIHRDIKPANILLENGVERVKITDFGLARAADDAGITRTGEVTGTPHYMSPEQAQGLKVDVRSDLFSLGSVMYAMCTGRSPFRAKTAMAALRHVCDNTPRPVREINSDVPDWLTAIIDRLLQKDPDDRFQTAGEVAELLGRHLAHLQHPSVASLPTPAHLENPDSTLSFVRQLRRPAKRSLVITAAVVVLLLGGLSLTEATGVTHLSSTVVRIVTGEGTLVIEVDDPSVQVSLDGEELTITGAGLQEITLRPGQYQFEALKDGRPLKKELVSITRGDRRVVRVTREPVGTQTAVSADVKRGAFVVLGGNGVSERRFDTLAEAVLAASDGDKIEVHGNGPFVTEPISLKHALTIRAGDGFRPVLTMSHEAHWTSKFLLRTNSDLVLEGLEFIREKLVDDEMWPAILFCSGPSVHVANCRFVKRFNPPGTGHSMRCVQVDAPLCDFRNCEFMISSEGDAVTWRPGPERQLTLKNCIIAGMIGMRDQVAREVPSSVRIMQCSLISTENVIYDKAFYEQKFRKANVAERGVELSAVQSIFDHKWSVLVLHGFQTVSGPADVQQSFGWRDDCNLLTPGPNLILKSPFPRDDPAQKTEVIIRDDEHLANWKQYWNTPDATVIHAKPRYRGGDLHSKRLTPDQLTPEDFRLRPDSPGYQAGPNGEDLGANIDFVGPGPAYERWKKTEAYQQWLQDTGQLREPTTATSEKQAFVLLTGDGDEVRKFDTLSDAVIGASDRDTIEICGNGPFVSQPVKLGTKRLTIRAATGFRPVIKLSPDAVHRRGDLLLATSAALVLEGLELHRVRSELVQSGGMQVVQTFQAPLQATNCRFQGLIWADRSPACEFRNCEFLGDGHSSCALGQVCRPGARVTFENCLSRAPGGILIVYEDTSFDDVSVQVKRSTSVSSRSAVFLSLKGSLLASSDAQAGSKLLRVEVSGSILDAPNAFMLDQVGESLEQATAPQPADAEAALLRLVEWQGEQNAFSPGSTSVGWNAAAKAQPPHGPKGLEEWKRFWGTQDADSLEGRLRFQGGDLLTRTGAALEELTPEDFRLRPDSAGYQAGPNGEDLGANIDFVGPGEAYERWKKTEAYQQWLQDTGRGESSE